MDEDSLTVKIGPATDPWVIRITPPTTGWGRISKQWFRSFLKSSTISQQIRVDTLSADIKRPKRPKKSRAQ